MADPQQERTPLDDLFRKTFENLPDAPSASGWDAPSEKVWQHVQSHIRPPRSGWSLQGLSLIAAFAVVVAVGLYFLTQRQPAQPQPAAVPAPVEAPVHVAPAPQSAMPEAEQPVTATPSAKPAAKPATSTKPAAQPLPKNSTQQAPNERK
ncbi:MAG TPA: hypothetical protein PK858_10270, partial [Saprospiraceae bacterium]|nr:hypothetical protein [Saprospiraceae bacterium]